MLHITGKNHSRRFCCAALVLVSPPKLHQLVFSLCFSHIMLSNPQVRVGPYSCDTFSHWRRPTTQLTAAPSTSCSATRSWSTSARLRIFGRPERDASRSGSARHPARTHANLQCHVDTALQRRRRQAAAGRRLGRAALGCGTRPQRRSSSDDAAGVAAATPIDNDGDDKDDSSVVGDDGVDNGHGGGTNARGSLCTSRGRPDGQSWTGWGG